MVEKLSDKLVLKSLEKFGSRLDEFIKQDPERNENQQEPEIGDDGNVEVNRRESIVVGAENVSITNLPADQTSLANLTRKRTLFSHVQNTMLDTSIASPAGFNRKNRFFSSTHREVEPDFLPGSFSTQASSTILTDISQGTSSDATRKRNPPSSSHETDSSDSEVTFRRPEKISRTNLPAAVRDLFDYLILRLQFSSNNITTKIAISYHFMTTSLVLFSLPLSFYVASMSKSVFHF